jgi:hypothetical protein
MKYHVQRPNCPNEFQQHPIYLGRNTVYALYREHSTSRHYSTFLSEQLHNFQSLIIIMKLSTFILVPAVLAAPIIQGGETTSDKSAQGKEDHDYIENCSRN